MGDAEFLEIRDFLDQAGERSPMFCAGCRMPREATHMDFINDSFIQRLGRECLLTPVITGIGYNPAQAVSARNCLPAIPIIIVNRTRPGI